MDKWKEYKLGEITSKIGSGATPKGGKESYLGGDIALIRSQNVLDFAFTSSGLVYINKEQASKLNNVEVKENDILLNITGDSVARTCIVPQNVLPARVNQHVAIIRGNDIVDNRYLLYYLQYIKPYLLSLSQGGATRNALTKKMLEDLGIKVPSKSVQNIIVSILSSLDDKIELNRRINENLEQQAQTLFKSWFVDFEPFKDGKFVDSELGMIPEGWKVIELQSMVTIKRGGSPRPIQEYLSETGLRWLKISDATCNSSPFILEIKEHIKESGLNKTVLLNKGELVLSNSATPGIPKFLGVDSCIHDGWLYFPVSSLSKEFLYLLFKEKRNELLSQGNGSVFLNLKTEIVKSLKVAICSKNTLEKFDDIIMPIFNKIFELSLEIDRLTELRDTLLPKLMTGEIKVN